MMAGKMKYRIVLLEPKRTTDKFGAEVDTYEQTRTVHAQRVSTSGDRSEEVGEHFPDYKVEFNIRDAHPVDENWRVQQLGGYLYTVTNIVPNLDRGMKSLKCVRVNE